MISKPKLFVIQHKKGIWLVELFLWQWPVNEVLQLVPCPGVQVLYILEPDWIQLCEEELQLSPWVRNEPNFSNFCDKSPPFSTTPTVCSPGWRWKIVVKKLVHPNFSCWGQSGKILQAHRKETIFCISLWLDFILTLTWMCSGCTVSHWGTWVQVQTWPPHWCWCCTGSTHGFSCQLGREKESLPTGQQ